MPLELFLFPAPISPTRFRVAPTSSRFSLSTIDLLPREGQPILDRLPSFAGDDRAVTHKCDALGFRSNNPGGR